MNYTIEHIAKVIEGSFLHFCTSSRIEYLLTDSRKLIYAQESLFIALSGSRKDGHEFIGQLYDKGVRNFLVLKAPVGKQYPLANIIMVSDTLRAMQRLVAYHRSQFGIPVIGITGSNGKTIVKEWLNQLLEDQYAIVRSPKSYNSQIGVALSVWQLNDSHELGIFEAGISRRGEMDHLQKMILPTIGVLTNIGEAHAEGFNNAAEKLREKLILFKDADVLIYGINSDLLPANVRRAVANSSSAGRKEEMQFFDWGFDKEATVQIRGIEKLAAAALIRVQYEDAIFSISIPFSDYASIENAIVCICTLLYLKVPLAAIATKFQRITAVSMRMELKSGINNCSLINDSYSADLSSLKIALDFLSQQQQHDRRTVILSDILQSGRPDVDLYGEVSRLLYQKKINRIFAIGDRISANSDLFERFGEAIRFYPSTDEFLRIFNDLSFRNETILLKGARVFAFEKIDLLLSRQAHQTILEISMDAISHNLKSYQQQLLPSTRIMAMVKAFSYGTGSHEIAKLLEFHKVDYLGVAYADEGVQLRQAGITLPIMVMNPEDASMDALVQFNLEPVIYSFRVLQVVHSFLEKVAITGFPAHIEVDSGMKRLGFAEADAATLSLILPTSALRIQSIFSHLAASENPQHDGFTRQQADVFLRVATVLESCLDYPVLRHLLNSAGIVRHPDLQLNMVRLGIGLYGIDSSKSHPVELQEAASLKSTIAQIRQVKPGETVGYDRKGLAQENITIATICVGYADGYPRVLGNGKGKMWLKGCLVPTIGDICMDMTMIDITGIAGVQENDEVLIFGKELPIALMAHWAGTIPYEILTGVSQRVKRVHFEV